MPIYFAAAGKIRSFVEIFQTKYISMKKMLTGIIAAFILLSSFSVSAQMRWGATAGFNLTDLNWSQQNLRTTPFVSDKSAGYFAGIAGEYAIPGIGFCIDLGLQYSQRGATMNLGDFTVWNSDGYGNERSYLHYLDIPIHLRFKYTNLNGVERTIAPLVFAGPSISVLLAHNDIKAFDYKSVVFGIEVGGGVELFRNYQLTASYIWDVTGAISAVKLSNFKAKNGTLKIGLTYLF